MTAGSNWSRPLGQAEVKRAGDDVTIVALSRSVLHALDAAQKLADEGISAEVIDLRSTRPLDLETVLRSIHKTHRAVVVHEAVQFGSILSELAAEIQENAFDYLDAPVLRLGGADSPVAYSQPLEQAQLPDADRIVRAARRLVTGEEA